VGARSLALDAGNSERVDVEIGERALSWYDEDVGE